MDDRSLSRNPSRESRYTQSRVVFERILSALLLPEGNNSFYDVEKYINFIVTSRVVGAPGTITSRGDDTTKRKGQRVKTDRDERKYMVETKETLGTVWCTVGNESFGSPFLRGKRGL